MKKIGIIYFVIVVLSIIMLFMPEYITKKENMLLNEEKTYYEESIKTKCLFTEKLKEKFKRKITNINVDKEKNIEKKIIDANEAINEGYSFSMDRLKIKDLINKDKINEYINNIQIEKENINIYKNKIDEIKEFDLTIYYDYIEKYNKYFDSTINLLDYLNNNKDYWNEEKDEIIFNKRKKYNEYKELEDNLNSLISDKAVLIKDITGPVINASNISIYVNDKIDLKNRIKCYDEVDDEVECIIKGSYDTSKVGTYTINIEASDFSNNISKKTINLYVKSKTNVVSYTGKPYYIEVIRNQNTVIVYGLDNSNNYTKIVKVFPCSVGRNNWTPTGTYKTTKGSTWGGLFGNVYGQYTTRITGNILFHSVPYYTKDKSNLEWEEYNKLGTAASAGCVRMTVRDVKWIFDNCASGTTVKIYDGNLPNGVSKPSAPKIDGSNPNRGWDPTDPDPNNPWK